MVPPALLPFYRNSAIREVKIPHTQMAMELMAPWSSPISMALVVPRAWLQAPMASPSATGSVMRNHLANRGAHTAPVIPAIATAAAAIPWMPPRLSAMPTAMAVVTLLGSREAGTRNLLVDTGFRTEGCKKALLEGLAQLGVSMEDTDILLTHLHADHSGNAPELIRPGGKVYISREDYRFMDGTLQEHRSERFRENGIAEDLLQAMLACTPSRTMAAPLSFRDYTLLEEGDMIPAGRYMLRAIWTPGHTPGHFCFEVCGTGAMLLGDHVLFDITPNITDWWDVPDSLGDYLRSLDKIAAYPVTLPLPGHREAGDMKLRISQLKEHHKKRLADCLRIVRELQHDPVKKPCLYDITGCMKWKIHCNGWDDFPPAQRWFALGECFAHLDHLKQEGLVREVHGESGVHYEPVEK